VMALRDMIRLIRERTNLSAEDAYTLCSLAADLRVTQTVNGSKGIHVMLAKSLSEWQVIHRDCGVAVISLLRVTSLLTRTSWQLVHPIAIAEWTNFPLALSA